MDNRLEQAIEQMRLHDERGLNYIYSKTYNYVYLRAKCILESEEDVRLLMQKIYQQTYESAGELKRETLYEWLGKKTYLLGAEQCRKRKEREVPFLEMEKEEMGGRKPEHLNESIELINGVLEQLPELYQATLFAFYFDYLKVEEIAELMECSPDVIKNRLNYARRFIKKAMEDGQEEGQTKYEFSVEIVCLALRKWAVDHCLGITSAQSVYHNICKQLKMQGKSIYLEGKEFAGVKNTVVHYKPDDWNPILEELAAYAKKDGINKRIFAYIIGGVAVLAVVIAAIVLVVGKTDKKDIAKKPAVTDEQKEQAETDDENADKKEEQDAQEPASDTDVQEPSDEGTDQNTDGTAEPQEPSADADTSQEVQEYIFPNSGTTELTREEVQSKTKEELRIARNEIYARHGATFGVEDLDQYFRSKSWYEPKMSVSELLASVELSLVEEGNISLIKEVESGM